MAKGRETLDVRHRSYCKIYDAYYKNIVTPCGYKLLLHRIAFFSIKIKENYSNIETIDTIATIRLSRYLFVTCVYNNTMH